jgi:hypothetical protein
MFPVTVISKSFSLAETEETLPLFSVAVLVPSIIISAPFIFVLPS